MTDPNIALSQHLIKRLEEQTRCLESLVSQVLYTSSALEGTWIAIKKAQDTWQRGIEKH